MQIKTPSYFIMTNKQIYFLQLVKGDPIDFGKF